MIKVNRDGAQITLTTDPGNGWSYSFEWTAGGGDDHAALVTQAIRDRMYRDLQYIREEAYHQGWADAKAKRTKKTWWKGFWD